MRGNPIGSQVLKGSLICEIGAMLTPNPALWESIISFPNTVYGIMASCAGSEGMSRGPFAKTPSLYPGTGSHIPERSRTGGGPGFLPEASKDVCGRFQPST